MKEMSNMKKLFKINIVLIIIAVFMFGLQSRNYVVYAEDAKQKAQNWGGLFSDADNFIKKGTEKKDNSQGINEAAMKTQFSSIYQVLLAIGTSLTVIIGGILGIKFMISSAEEKAKIKEMMIPYVLGCVVIFGAFGIWKVTVKIGENMMNSTYVDNQLQNTRQKNSEDVNNIENGNYDFDSKTDAELRSLYGSQRIDEDLNTKMQRGGKTFEEAYNELSETKKKIYDECKKRGILNTDGVNLKT